MLLPVVVVLAAPPVAGHDVTFRAGGRGWVYETFGGDVAVLRAPVGPAGTVGSAGAGGDEVAWLLSCSGQDRRVRLSFPRPIAGAGETTGSLLLRPAGVPNRPPRALVSRFGMADPSTLVIGRTESFPLDAVFAIGNMLERRPSSLEIVVGFGRDPVSLNRLQPYRVALSFEPHDNAVIGHFLTACGRASLGRAE
ncbi:hypothetical protein [uncultured Enterovirga sp.]|uniref:hypothetical protein n=1 Tax=uncultured Enterovirga sp. TaxID=2026352 RepID=UPI0035CA3F1A